MKKYIKNIFIIVMLLMLGIFLGYFAKLGSHMISSSGKYVSFDIVYIIAIFIFTYFVSILIHELAHFITFVRNGVSMRAMYVLYFLFIKENNGWKLKFRPNSLTTLGGLAIPDFEYVKDEEHFKELQSAYSKTLIWGPISSTLLFVFNVTIFIIGYFIINNNIINTIILINFISSSIITLIIIVTSMLKSELVIGDFAAYKLAKTDDFFTGMVLYQSSIYSTKPNYVKENNLYLRKLLIQKLDERLKDKDYHIYTLSVIDSLLLDYLVGNIKTLPNVVESYINLLLTNRVLDNKKDENSISLMFHIIIYISITDSEKAKDIFNSYKKELNLKLPYIKYFIKQIEHILNVKDHSEYLSTKENIIISQAHSIYKNFNGYYIDNLNINLNYKK